MSAAARCARAHPKREQPTPKHHAAVFAPPTSPKGSSLAIYHTAIARSPGDSGAFSKRLNE